MSESIFDILERVLGVPMHPDPTARELLLRGVRWPGCQYGSTAPTGMARELLEIAARARGGRAPR